MTVATRPGDVAVAPVEPHTMTSLDRIYLTYCAIVGGWATGKDIDRRIGHAVACELLEALTDEAPCAEVALLTEQLVQLLAEMNDATSSDGFPGKPSGSL